MEREVELLHLVVNLLSYPNTRVFRTITAAVVHIRWIVSQQHGRYTSSVTFD